MTEVVSGIIPTCAGVGGGWRRIANGDVAALDNCPRGWYRATHSGVAFCYQGGTFIGRGGSVCSSTAFSTNGISYQRVCGRARGYQKGHTTAFWGYNIFSPTIDGAYMPYYLSDPLWDISNCFRSTECCSNITQPWFYHELNSSTTSDIEARLCSVDGFVARAVLIDQLELYIQ